MSNNIEFISAEEIAVRKVYLKRAQGFLTKIPLVAQNELSSPQLLDILKMETELESYAESGGDAYLVFAFIKLIDGQPTLHALYPLYRPLACVTRDPIFTSNNQQPDTENLTEIGMDEEFLKNQSLN